MSGNLLAYAIPTAPVIDTRGMLTPAWYRFFLSLVARTGGTAGKVTPTLTGETVFLDGLLGGGGEVASGDVRLELGGDGVRETGAGWWPQDAPSRAPGAAWAPDPVWTVRDAPQFPPDPGGIWAAPFWPTSSPNSSPPVVAITPGASPFTYEAPAPGFVLLTGGTVSSVTWSRDGATFLATGMTAGFFPCEAGDMIVVTYTVAPTMNLLGSVV